jgi:hypothetical protein
VVLVLAATAARAALAAGRGWLVLLAPQAALAALVGPRALLALRLTVSPTSPRQFQAAIFAADRSTEADTMSLAVYNGTVLKKITDDVAQLVPGAHIEVRREIVGLPLAVLKSDRDGATGKDNPFDAGADGAFSFYVIGGAYQIRAYTGTSEAPTFEVFLHHVAIGLNAEGDTAGSRVKRTVTVAGAVTADAEDEIIIINKTVGEATVVNVDWSARTTALTVVDGKGDAATNNITIVPATGQTQYAAVDYVITIDQDGDSVTLSPLPDGTGGFKGN